MKATITKATWLFAILFYLPCISHAQQTPPENLITSPAVSWMVVLGSIGAIYGISKMHKRNQTLK